LQWAGLQNSNALSALAAIKPAILLRRPCPSISPRLEIRIEKTRQGPKDGRNRIVRTVEAVTNAGRAASLHAGRPCSYATAIKGCVIQARIPMSRCVPPGGRGVMTQQRKQSHDKENSRVRRVDNDAGCDLRICICARGRIVRPGMARSGRPLRPASATRQCFLSEVGDADGRAQCAPLSWRAEIERLTFFDSPPRRDGKPCAGAARSTHQRPQIPDSPVSYLESRRGDQRRACPNIAR
jgi:hypothetical protein